VSSTAGYEALVEAAQKVRFGPRGMAIVVGVSRGVVLWPDEVAAGCVRGIWEAIAESRPMPAGGAG
jgi:hypothetical protein